jgi:site-specific recombinase XerD
MKICEISERIDHVISTMHDKKYAEGTIKSYRCIYNAMLIFFEDHHITNINEHKLLDFISIKSGYEVKGFYGKGNDKINRIMKPVHVLWDYILTGDFIFRIRPKIAPFVCPLQFSEEYENYKVMLNEAKYPKSTLLNLIPKIDKLLIFLDDNSVLSLNDVSVIDVIDFIKIYKDNAPKYITTIIYALRKFFSFLYFEKYIDEDIHSKLPRVRIMRNAFIPYTWRVEDVKKLLDVIDRADPKGKRDYAIILLVVRLGLRVSDIRGLCFKSLDWNNKMISLIMQKSQRPLKLPLLDDVGWAIIDYLRNGRPDSSSERVFIRHRAPYDSVGENESFYRELHRYMVAANIDAPLDVHCGLHSLRSTLASVMLEQATPLNIISNTLGHKSTNTTSIYLKIDLKGLRKCALDPEEVFQS